MIKRILRATRLTLDSYIIHYSKVNAKPNVINALSLTPYFIIRRFKGFRLLTKFIQSVNFPSEYSKKINKLPKIELLFVCTQKDGATLLHVIENARKHSLNPVSKIIVIVPEMQVSFFSDLLSDLPFPSPVEVISEDNELDEKSRDLIKKTMGDRYGWTLQQFLTVCYCLRSSAAGVLAVNSDTVILRDQTWLDSTGQQILMESYEYNPDYYELLRKVNPKFGDLSHSHVTHHMIFQPKILKECLNFFNVDGVSEFIQLFMRHINPESASPICAEFEPYAQYLRKRGTHCFTMVKFSNVPVKRTQETNLPRVIRKFEQEALYNSISFHSWMD